MLRFKILFLAAALTTVQWSGFAAQADAQGPLRNWLRNVFRRGQTAQRYYPNVGNCATNPQGLLPGQCSTTCQKTCSRVVVNYVPYTAYRTNWNRVPVTQYKPVTNSDPCTGCTVTCMRPCTTYTYQMQRVPYTTYRPVYRTETYKVPVTTITNNCNTCPTGCATGCATCPTSTGYAPTVNGCSTCAIPGTTYTTPNGALSNGATYTPVPSNGVRTTPAPTPADQTPTLNDNPQTQQRVYDQIQGQGNASTNQMPNNNETWTTSVSAPQEDWTNRAPARINVDRLSAQNPVRQEFAYSPIRQASYTSVVTEVEKPKLEIRTGGFSSNRTLEKPKPPRKTNSAWKAMDW